MNDNDMLTIELRNRDNSDVSRLIARIQELEQFVRSRGRDRADTDWRRTGSFPMERAT